MNLSDHISSNPNIMLGKPTIKGTRITVESILRKLAEGFSIDDILKASPHIKTTDIQACIVYAADVIQYEHIIPAA